MKFLAVLLGVLCAASAAGAAVTVEEHTLQKGLYEKPGCTFTPPKTEADKNDIDAHFNECLCEADIRYPELKGMESTPTDTINIALKKTAQDVRCTGNHTDARPKKDIFISSRTHTYTISYQSNNFLGINMYDSEYSGGAHGGSNVSGVIIDITGGKLLQFSDVINSKNAALVNAQIYKELSAKPEGDVFRDVVEEHKEDYIKNGACDGCTLLLGKDGLKLVFEAYVVGPGASGPIAVTLPPALISYPTLAKELEKK